MTERSAFTKWREWDIQNPGFYPLFRRFALEAAKAGRSRFSPWMVVNRIRWETTITTQGEDFKCPNGVIAYYSRLFMVENPRFRGFFTTRTLREPVSEEQFKAHLGARQSLRLG